MYNFTGKMVGAIAACGLVAGCLSTGLNMPTAAKSPVPAVILVGGTGGSNGRFEYHGPALQDSGFAVYLTEYWQPHNKSSPVSSYIERAYDTLKELQENPKIDPNRIAIMGFSRGGYLAMLTALKGEKEKYMGHRSGFAAHIGFYPYCWGHVYTLPGNETGAPILVLAGSEDDWGNVKEKESCPELVDALNKGGAKIAELVMYPGAGHGFDAEFGWNGKAASDSRTRVVEFLKRELHSE